MAEKITIKVEKREGRGRNFSRNLRRDGKIPAVVYGGGEDSVAITADLKDLAAIIRSDSGVNTLFTLDIGDGSENRVIFQDRQIDPVTGRLVHADLRRLAKGEKIELMIPVNLIGEPKGLDEEGSLLDQLMREISVKCLPSNIPDSIDVNVEHLEMNEAIHISDIKFDDDIEVLDDPESIVAAVVFVREEVLEPEVDEDAEPEIIGEEVEEGAEGEGVEGETEDGN